MNHISNVLDVRGRDVGECGTKTEFGSGRDDCGEDGDCVGSVKTCAIAGHEDSDMSN